MKLFVDHTKQFPFIPETIAYYKKIGVSLAIELVGDYWILYSSYEELIKSIRWCYQNQTTLKPHSHNFYDFKVLLVSLDAMEEIIQFMVKYHGLELGGE